MESAARSRMVRASRCACSAWSGGGKSRGQVGPDDRQIEKILSNALLCLRIERLLRSLEQQIASFPDGLDGAYQISSLFTGRRKDSVAEANDLGEIVELDGFLSQFRLVDLCSQSGLERLGGWYQLGGAFQSAVEDADRLGEPMFAPESPCVLQDRLDLVDSLASELVPQEQQREGRGQSEGPGSPASEGARLPPAPFSPSFSPVAVGNTAEGQVIEKSAQVISHRGRVVIALGRVRGQTFMGDIRQSAADQGIAMPPGSAGCPFNPSSRTAQRLTQQQSQCIEISAVVDRSRSALSPAHGLQGGLLLGCHPRRRPTEAVNDPFPRLDRLSSEVEIEQHG